MRLLRRLVGERVPTKRIDAKPRQQDQLQDTMIMREGLAGRISQDRLARLLELSGKGGFGGSQVAVAWETGEYDTGCDYNEDDVETVRRIWKRLTGHAPIALLIVETPPLAPPALPTVRPTLAGFYPGGFRPGPRE